MKVDLSPSLNDKELEFIAKHMIPIHVHQSDIPYSVLVAFPKALKDESFRRKLTKLYRLGHDKNYAYVYLMKNDKATMITRIQAISYDFNAKFVKMRLANDMTVYLASSDIKDIDEFLSAIKDYVQLTVYVDKVRHGKFETRIVRVDSIKPLTAHLDDNAHIIYEGVDDIFSTLVIGFGLNPEPLVNRYMLARIVGLFKVDGLPIYVCQFTPRETGKTTFAVRLLTLMNFDYLTEVPTLARLVFDSRFRSYGIIYFRDGIVLDEFDKYGKFYDRFQQLISTLLTGMEQGLWGRGISGVQPIQKYVNIIIFGNYERTLVSITSAREYFNTYYASMFRIDVTQLESRINVIEVLPFRWRAYDSVLGYVMKDSVLRTLIKIIENTANKVSREERSSLHGRYKRHAERIYKVMKALRIDVSIDIVDEWVRSGRLPIDNQLPKV